jgi:hypothetical protein
MVLEKLDNLVRSDSEGKTFADQGSVLVVVVHVLRKRHIDSSRTRVFGGRVEAQVLAVGDLADVDVPGSDVLSLEVSHCGLGLALIFHEKNSIAVFPAVGTDAKDDRPLDHVEVLEEVLDLVVPHPPRQTSEFESNFLIIRD